MAAMPDATAGAPHPAIDPLEDAGAPPVGADEVALHPGERLLQGRWGWLDVVIVGPMLAKSVYYYAGIPLGQWLILHRHPIRASLLRGSIPALILSGAGVRTSGISIWVALFAALPYTMVTDPCFYYGGRRYGRVLIDYFCRTDPRWTRRMARGERIFARYAGWAVFLAPVIWLPNEVFYFLAGETRMRFSRFIVLDVAGQLAFIAEIVALGYFIGQPAENLATALSRYTLWIVAGTVILIIAASVAGGVRRAAAMR
jgi:membrane protein DedA with SNARE-associated domain